tara:strand:+ start:490 stop:660 length:171 start_codon:yes stop_codon:yes gene_type:complete
MSELLRMTEEDIEGLKKAYQGCQGDRFEYQGKTFLKEYAKYLLEYLDGIPRPEKTK